MTMEVLKKMVPVPDLITNHQDFRLMLETHRFYLRQSGNFDPHIVDTHEAYKYRYDLYGYLTAQAVNPELHWITMRLSDMESPMELDENVSYLIIPKNEVYAKLKSLYVTSLGKMGKS